MIISLFSCAGSDNIDKGSPNKTQTVNVKTKNFTGIDLEGSPSVFYEQGDVCSVKIVGDKKMTSKIRTEVEDGVLHIWVEGNMVSVGTFFTPGSTVSIYVTSPDLTDVVVRGSGDFTASKKVDTDHLRLQLNGSGDITFADIICDSIRTKLMGSGDIRIKNVEAISSAIDVVGSGDVSVKQLNVENTGISLVGSGDVSVSFRNCGAVNCRLVGSGDISLSGNVRKFRKTSAGSGDFHTSGLRVEKQ